MGERVFWLWSGFRDIHVLLVKGASRVSFRDLRSHEQARGGRFRKNDFTRLDGNQNEHCCCRLGGAGKSGSETESLDSGEWWMLIGY